jgi:hypothetical protein
MIIKIPYGPTDYYFYRYFAIWAKKYNYVETYKLLYTARSLGVELVGFFIPFVSLI